MKPILVIGLGNRLMGDDGVGCAVAERLAAHAALPDTVEVAEGGTDLLRFVDDVQGRQRVIVGDALKLGENERIEFKRDAGDRESILRTVTAFANSNDGTIFVGVANNGQVVGIDVSSLEDKDRFVTSLQNAIRDRIRPTPFIDAGFEDTDGRTVAVIFVPRGDQPLYCCDGRPYLRKGPQSVAGNGDEVARTVLEFA